MLSEYYTYNSGHMSEPYFKTSKTLTEHLQSKSNNMSHLSEDQCRRFQLVTSM